jgi:pimeloyl-ACP methyl ester carboxylesterase
MKVQVLPYSTNQEICIHYEVEGDGSPLVLLHGLCSSLKVWYELGYVRFLKNDYRLILIDARGHGASDKPQYLESYKLKSMVSDIVAVLNDLNIRKAHFLGFSMGGWIGFGIAKYAPERYYSLIIGGMHPYETDPGEPSLEDVLPTMTMPCLLFAGENDPFYSGAKECAENMPNATFVSLPGLGHIEALYRSDLVLPHIAVFLDRTAEVTRIQSSGSTRVSE